MNKQQKEFKSFYSIRKSSLGVASVAISTLFIINVKWQKAQAAAEGNGVVQMQKHSQKLKQVASPTTTSEKLQKLNQ